MHGMAERKDYSVFSPSFTLGLALGVVYSVGFDKCGMSGIHHHSIIQMVSLPKNSPVLHLPSPQTAVHY